MTKYWISVRAVSGGAFSDDIDLGGTRYLEIPDGETPTPQHAVAMDKGHHSQLSEGAGAT
jgi:hypothetical protein